MTLDVVVATFNRAALLSRLLESLRNAKQPPGLRIRTIVVDNNSTDGTRAVVERARRDWPGRLEYRFEKIQSKSAALNNALSIVTAEVVGLLDDDEEVHPRWFEVVARTFADPSVDFISGPYFPRWGAPQPSWLPKDDYPGVIGWLDAGDRVLEYGKNYDGVLMGGNAVVRTAAGIAAGWFHPSLGRVGAQIGSGCEDVDFFERLQRLGARGLYVPELIIYHYIPPRRLTKRYYREWCFRRFVAQAEADVLRPQPVKYLFGVPRYMIGKALRSIPFVISSAIGRRWNDRITFSRELAMWELAGFLAGIVKRQRTTARA
jgi:glycosyltransferase involved in cell wall biosynthesis